MDALKPPDDKGCSGDDYVQPDSVDTTVQLVISLALGFSAFLAFCVRAPFFSPSTRRKGGFMVLTSGPVPVDSPAAMEIPLRSEKAAARHLRCATHPSRQLPGLDPGAV